ncbi:MAG: DNA topoisomerase IV subunit A [Dermatophilaceae bacterium]
MARRTTTAEPPVDERIVDVDVEDEMQGAFLEYAYSVIYSRALPDARDGLKPVQRRILYGMSELGLRPDRPHVKCSRIVGEVMGKYHPHGDTAIYDALVRLAQPWTMRLPPVDGHGNFGSLDDGPAASRYTEARLAPAALLMTTGLDEDTVAMVPNYDEQFTQPEVLPAAFPNLLVNGASGIAVGMATNMPPHNLVEVIAAARHLIVHPGASLEELMRFVPGPDLPGGGRIVGLDGIREAYEGGRGPFRTRATARIESLTPRRKSIVVTELPYLVGVEKVREKIKDLVQAKKLQGIADFTDLTDLKHGLRLVIDVKNGFHPEAVLEQLYKLTPMEESFGINNVALVDGQPRTLGLREMLTVYVDFRTEVVRRRTAHRLSRRQERLHLVDGLLVAILNIDEVIRIIRGSDNAALARDTLRRVFTLSEEQSAYILDLQLRRLTKFSRLELEEEQEQLRAAIEELRAILADHARLLKVVSDELAEVARKHGTPRRTVLLESGGAPRVVTTPLEVADDACWILLSSAHLVARTRDAAPPSDAGPRCAHDAVISRVQSTARGDVGVVTSAGRVVRLSALELPALPPTHDAPSLAGGAPLAAFLDLGDGEVPLALLSLAGDSPGLALGTAGGIVKRLTTDYPGGRNEWEAISLKDGDTVVGAVELRTGNEHLVFVTKDAQLLRFPADAVRPQGRGAGGMAGIKLGVADEAIWFGAVNPLDPAGIVVTVAGSDDGVPGTEAGSVKVTSFADFPVKGRATGGIRAHRFLSGEARLLVGWAGASPARAAGLGGAPVALPQATGKRDGSGASAAAPIVAIAGAHRDAPGSGRSAATGEPAGKGTSVSGLASGDALFDLDDAQVQTPRPRPAVDRSDYDPDDVGDAVQVSKE